MKILSVEAIPLAAKVQTPLRMPKQIFDTFCTTLVRIRTDNGLVGLGECICRKGPLIAKQIVDELLAPILIGKDPQNVEGLWQEMFESMRGRGHSGGFFLEAISGADTALWDLLGKFYRQPLGKLLGGCGRTQAPAYASSIMLKSTPEMVSEACDLVEEGYRAIKIKVGLGASQDIQNAREIRKAVGDGVQLMADANSAYGYREALAVGRALDELGFLWFEEPVPPDDLAGYRDLSRRLDLSIAGGESEFSVYGFRRLLEEGEADLVQPDVSRCGGVTESRKIANLAQAFHRQYAPHTGFSSAVCLFASMQLASYATNFFSYEYVLLNNPLLHILDTPIPPVRDGLLEIPQGLGLGACLDEEKIAYYRIPS